MRERIKKIRKRLQMSVKSETISKLIEGCRAEKAHLEQEYEASTRRVPEIIVAPDGVAKVSELNSRLREIGETLELIQQLIAEAEEKLKTQLRNEYDKKLILDSKQWADDAKVEFELRDMWLNSAAQTFELHLAYFDARQKGNSWRTIVGRSDTLGLKPVDPLDELLTKNNLKRPHPINDEALFKALQAVAKFKNELDGLGFLLGKNASV